MNNKKAYTWALNIFFVLCVSVFGIMCGLFTGSFTIQEQDGFDEIADLLGMAIAGALFGLYAGFMAVPRLTHRQKKIASIVLSLIIIAFSSWIASEMT